ncbi:hypothetical protein D3C77_661880 [compost metagenome]
MFQAQRQAICHTAPGKAFVVFRVRVQVRGVDRKVAFLYFQAAASIAHAPFAGKRPQRRRAELLELLLTFLAA